MLTQLRRSARDLMQRVAFGAVGAMFLVAGIGFLTAAAVIALALAYGGLIACLITGCVFAGLGLICVAIASRRRPPPPLPPPARATIGQTALIDAFLGGLNTGRSMTRKRGGR